MRRMRRLPTWVRSRGHSLIAEPRHRRWQSPRPHGSASPAASASSASDRCNLFGANRRQPMTTVAFRDLRSCQRPVFSNEGVNGDVTTLIWRTYGCQRGMGIIGQHR
jgi:hypothetical protein